MMGQVVMTACMRMFERKRNGLAQMFVLVGGARAFSAHKMRIAHDPHEVLRFIEDLVLLPFTKSFGHGATKQYAPDVKIGLPECPGWEEHDKVFHSPKNKIP